MDSPIRIETIDYDEDSPHTFLFVFIFILLFFISNCSGSRFTTIYYDATKAFRPQQYAYGMKPELNCIHLSPDITLLIFATMRNT